MSASPTHAALVTGAGKRLGAAFARALAEDGWYVVIHYRSSADEAAEVLAGIEAAGGRGRLLQADLEQPSELETVVARAAEGAPPLTLLVNSASLFAKDDAGAFTIEGWDRNLAVNLRAPTVLARDFAAALPAGETGSIVNLLDCKVFALNPDFFSYTVGKVGLLGVTEMLAMALAPRIRVNGIAPGITLISGAQTEESFERAHRANPLGRSSTPEDLVRALRFLVATPSMTGQVVTIDGGQTLQKLPRDIAYLS